MKSINWRPKAIRHAQSGIVHHALPVAIAFIILFGAIGTYLLMYSHAATSGTPELLSGITGGYCLNDPGDDLNSGSELNTALCNGSTDQQFQVAGTKIELGTANCLSPLGRATTIGTTVVLDHCHNYVAQNWSQNSSGQFINTNSGNCLSATGGIAGALLSIQSCNSHKAQKWTIGTYGSGGGGGSSCGSGIEASPVTSQCIAKGQAGAIWNLNATTPISSGGYGLQPSGENVTNWQCLVSLWTHESSWEWNATNPSSGAYGIPQSLPADKMASAGSDWKTDAATQIAWGLSYIKSVYGNPCGAWQHEVNNNWYGVDVVSNGTEQHF